MEELEQIAIVSDNPYSEAQLVNISIKLIKNFNDFEKSLTSWYKQPVGQDTMINFKLHFEHEYQALKRVREITMCSIGFHQQKMW